MNRRNTAILAALFFLLATVVFFAGMALSIPSAQEVNAHNTALRDATHTENLRWAADRTSDPSIAGDYQKAADKMLQSATEYTAIATPRQTTRSHFTLASALLATAGTTFACLWFIAAPKIYK